MRGVSVVKTPPFADRHPLVARILAAAIVLTLVGACVAAIVTSWGQPHAPLMTVVGLLVAVGLALIWRARDRVSLALTLATSLIGVLSASFVCFSSGWLRAFGAAVLLPLLLIPTVAILA